MVKCLQISTIIENNNEETNKLLINNAEKINMELFGFFPKYYKWKNGKFVNYIKSVNPNDLTKSIDTKDPIMDTARNIIDIFLP